MSEPKPKTANPHRPAVVAISGPQGAGKSTLAGALASSGPFARLSFAAPLRRMLAAMGVENLEDKTSPRPALCGKNVRQALQTLGTAWGRGMVGDTVWTGLLLDEARPLLASGMSVAVDDARFRDELGALRLLAAQAGAAFLSVRVPVPPGNAWPQDDHASEAEWPSFPVDLTLDPAPPQDWAWAVRRRLLRLRP
jgi:hypothetical protein